MGEFFKSKKFKILLAVVALLFGMMLYSASVDGIANIPKNLLSMITTPFQKASAYLSNATGDFFDTFLNASNHAKENDALKKEIDELNQKLVDYEALKDENEQLREITGIKDLHPDFEIVNASVMGRDPADRYGSFTIDKGSLHGVSINDPVITGSGLIGIVSDVSPINARVKTILSPEINVSAFENVTKELGIISGEVNFAQDGLCKLSILSEETTLKHGDLIVTAGSSGKFPKGIPVGKVANVFDEAHGITMYATITPMQEIDKIDNIQVITDFLGQGSELLDYLE